ncbi:MAG: hypothetical protein ACRD0W_03200 [Acidimicrobiales bacterium]
MKRPRTLSILTAIALAAGLTVGVAQPANAEQVIATGRLYKSDPLCVDAGARIFDDDIARPGNPYSSTSTYSRTYAFGITCGAPWLRPPTYIRANINLMMWGYLNNVGPAWYLCRQSGWQYNNTDIATLNFNWQFTVPPCGHTWYGTQSLNGVRNGPGWYGGDLWSGYLYVEPDTASSSALAGADFVVTYEGGQSPKAPPPGKKPPRFVPVAGPDGEAIRDASGELVMVDTLNPDSSTLGELDTLAPGGSTLLRGEVVSETRTVSRGPSGELTETLTIVGR